MGGGRMDGVSRGLRSLARHLAATGPWPRAAFGLAGIAAVAVHAWPVAIAPAPAPPPAVAAPPADGSALTRPLFDPGRRDWTARGSRSAVTEGEPHRPVLTLRGILLDGSTARALIDDGEGPVWLGRGEGRGDWQVSAIGADRVSVTQRGQTFAAEFMGPPATLRPARPAEDAVGLRP
ncbi:hypothetical protein [Methylobacterium oryzisoli]|uniref:hypothetical protein n=1 Tax=Methylobacterium oryzisoli TaxID=3385502 RepID=UPI0038920616